MGDASTPKLNLATKIFLVDSFVVLIFLLCGDLRFDFIFFIQLIWWIKALQIFKKIDQTEIIQILLYTLSIFFDSTNFIKLIWPCIRGHLSIVDWFKYLSDPLLWGRSLKFTLPLFKKGKVPTMGSMPPKWIHKVWLQVYRSQWCIRNL